MQKTPHALPQLPIVPPASVKWEVRIIAVVGRFALSIRRLGQTYANTLVGKSFGVSATTRNRNTIETVCKVLQNQGYDSASCGYSSRPGHKLI